jgi:hypothetical protein
MKTYNYDAFGNLGCVEITASGGSQVIVLVHRVLRGGCDVYMMSIKTWRRILWCFIGVDLQLHVV